MFSPRRGVKRGQRFQSGSPWPDEEEIMRERRAGANSTAALMIRATLRLILSKHWTYLVVAQVIISPFERSISAQNCFHVYF